MKCQICREVEAGYGQMICPTCKEIEKQKLLSPEVPVTKPAPKKATKRTNGKPVRKRVKRTPEERKAIAYAANKRWNEQNPGKAKESWQRWYKRTYVPKKGAYIIQQPDGRYAKFVRAESPGVAFNRAAVYKNLRNAHKAAIRVDGVVMRLQETEQKTLSVYEADKLKGTQP